MDSESVNVSSPLLAGLRVALVGRLAGMSKRDAAQLIRAHGGEVVDVADGDVQLVICADENLALDEARLAADQRRAIDAGDLVVLSETQLWQRLGLLDHDPAVRRMYTPAMLAELLAVPVAVIRRWQRRGMIVPRREVGRLAYFDFAEVATARQLAALQAAGISQRSLEKQLAGLARWLPAPERPLAQAALLVEGKRLLLRQGEGLLEAGGQQRFDFESSPAAGRGAAAPSEPESERDEARDVLSLDAAVMPEHATPSELVEAAQNCDASGQLTAAAELYRSALAAGGPDAEICFWLADVLYRLGELGASRERFYMAVELDEDYVEARANLGCVLAEAGECELAAAVLRGALAHQADFPDAHYHLARVLDDAGRHDEGAVHWRAFLELAPESPWAATARQRLGQPVAEVSADPGGAAH